MKRIAILFPMLFGLLAEAEDPGVQAWRQGDWQGALAHFQAASTNLGPVGAVASYNAGSALFHLDQPSNAVLHLEQSLATSDLDLQRDGYHNLGSAHLDQARLLEAATNVAAALEGCETAIEHYRNSLLLDGTDRSAKVNLELALQDRLRLKQILEQQQQQESPQDPPPDPPPEEEPPSEPPPDPPPEEEPPEEPEDNGEDPPDENPEEPPPSDPPEDPEGKGDDPPPDPGESEPESGEADPQPMEMSKEDVQRMLQALRAEEQAARDNRPLLFGSPTPTDRNW